MTQIAIPKVTPPNSKQLVIDIVVRVKSNLYHLGRVKQYRKKLYITAQTHRAESAPIDIHTSYHSDGKIWSKLTRGKLMVYPGGKVLGEVQPHTQEQILWQRKGQPLDSLKGVEKIAPQKAGVWNFIPIEGVADGYPTYISVDADHIFKIDVDSAHSAHIEIDYFMVEPDNKAALENAMKEITDGWNKDHLTAKLYPNEAVTLEQAELFTNFHPWLAIVLFRKSPRLRDPS